MIITEGKTKLVTETDNADEVILETKNSLTAGDGVKSETINGIAVHKTNQTCNVFNLLNKVGIPTSFIKRENERSIRCHKCNMVPLELVVRRYAWGSYLKRKPHITSTVENPYKFENLEVEFYHKDSVIMPSLSEKPIQIKEDEARKSYLKDGEWRKEVFTDPLIGHSYYEPEKWLLYPAKKVRNYLPFRYLMEIEPVLSPEETSYLIHHIILPTFKVLEKAWSEIRTEDGPVSLVDLKIEVGYRASDNELVIADVIDNDNWRIWPGADPSKQLDKQCFREGDSLDRVLSQYSVVSSKTDQFEFLYLEPLREINRKSPDFTEAIFHGIKKEEELQESCIFFGHNYLYLNNKNYYGLDKEFFSILESSRYIKSLF
jgi:phosphoribosylaminoimidazole-succinocarboxamide synthase